MAGGWFGLVAGGLCGENETMSDASSPPSPAIAWRSVAAITVGALALYAGFRALPTGTNLHHLDFRVEGAGALEMCDPNNPQFIPVVEARSPVRVALRPAEGGGPGKLRMTLTTAGGQPIGPVDLLTVHTRKLHLLAVDPTLTDYHHLHPVAGERPGDWDFELRPNLAGVYRVFADFTPAATGRGLYAFADIDAAALGGVEMTDGEAVPPHPTGVRVEKAGFWFELTTGDGAPIRAGRPGALRFAVSEPSGGEVPLSLVMDAYAHLVAFDRERSGFAHLHPRGQDPGTKTMPRPDARRPELWFDLTIPAAGEYVVWAQVNLAGREVYLPFALRVEG